MAKKKEWRTIITADLHLSNALPHSKPTGSNGFTDRFQDQLDGLEEMRRFAEQKKVDAVIILGDLWDRKLLDAVTLRGTIHALASFAPIEIYILPGNHDAHSAIAQRFTVEMFEETKLEHIHFLGGLEFPNPWRPRPWLYYWALPYAPIEATRSRLAHLRKEVEKSRKANPGDQHYLLMHNSVIGAKHLGWICDDGLDAMEVTQSFDHVFAGHFHDCQSFGDGIKGVGVYVGAPWQRDFGEEGYDCPLRLYKFKRDEAFAAERHQLTMPKFQTVHGLTTTHKFPKKGDFIRYVVEATHPDWLEQRAQARAMCEQLASEGVRAHAIHKPIYHHEERLAGSSEAAKVEGFEALVSSYVEAGSVVTEGLDTAALVRLGHEALKAVREKKR